jgi:hypothetical protein
MDMAFGGRFPFKPRFVCDMADLSSTSFNEQTRNELHTIHNAFRMLSREWAQNLNRTEALLAGARRSAAA